jgi:hypothetical protein
MYTNKLLMTFCRTTQINILSVPDKHIKQADYQHYLYG